MSLKLLIVDDSALMRKHLTQLFQAEGDFEIRQARNGREAIDENIEFQPDVITLDINMPELDGLSALAHIMASRPVPVVMVSSLTEKGALATFEAMALGAVDYVAKPDGTISLSLEKISAELVEKVRSATRARPHRKTPDTPRKPREATAPSASKRERPVAPPKNNVAAEPPDGMVLIGVSTGGPSTLETILQDLPEDFPFPVVVAQHMPKFFTEPFAKRLDQVCAMHVVEVNHPTELQRGTIYIARGGADVGFTVRGDSLYVQSRPESLEYRWHPSVELLGLSALQHCEAKQLIAVMLTGMGCDGAESFTAIHRQGGRTIAEAEESAIVFGMPKELIEHGGANVVLPAGRIAAQLIAWAGAGAH